jgi:hypothetical protein
MALNNLTKRNMAQPDVTDKVYLGKGNWKITTTATNLRASYSCNGEDWYDCNYYNSPIHLYSTHLWLQDNTSIVATKMPDECLPAYSRKAEKETNQNKQVNQDLETPPSNFYSDIL